MLPLMGVTRELPSGRAVCPRTIGFRAHMVGGGKRRVVFACGKLACTVCRHSWSARVRRRIVDGYRDGDQFVTLTFKYDPRDPSTHVTAEKALWCFRKFRRAVNRRRAAPFRYYRVLEVTKAGSVHIHLVCEPGLFPSTARASGLSFNGWWSKISPKSRAFADYLVSFGFAHIFNAERVRHGKGGVYAYCAKYTSKVDSKVVVDDDERAYYRDQDWPIRSPRVAEGSRNWYPVKVERTYASGHRERDKSLDGEPPELPPSLPDHPDLRRQVIRERLKYWQSQLPDSSDWHLLLRADGYVADGQAQMQRVWRTAHSAGVWQFDPKLAKSDWVHRELLAEWRRLGNAKAFRAKVVERDIRRVDGYMGPLYHLRETEPPDPDWELDDVETPSPVEL